jgi:hypothetical protein
MSHLFNSVNSAEPFGLRLAQNLLGNFPLSDSKAERFVYLVEVIQMLAGLAHPDQAIYDFAWEIVSVLERGLGLSK